MAFNDPVQIKEADGNIIKIPHETRIIFVNANAQGNSQLRLSPTKDIEGKVKNISVGAELKENGFIVRGN